MTRTSPVAPAAVQTPACWSVAVGYAILRLTLGLVFFLFGITKLMMGPGPFADSMVANFQKTWLPAVLVRIFGLVLPFVETTVGALLILGLLTRPALLLTGLLMAFLTFGIIVQGQGANVVNNLIYAILIFLLLLTADYNRVSVDRALTHRPS